MEGEVGGALVEVQAGLFARDWGIEVAGGRDDGADGYTVDAAVWVPLCDACV